MEYPCRTLYAPGRLSLHSVAAAGTSDEFGNHKLEFPNSPNPRCGLKVGIADSDRLSPHPTACFAAISPFRGGTVERVKAHLKGELAPKETEGYGRKISLPPALR